jgi:excisionase family DNA binding protein
MDKLLFTPIEAGHALGLGRTKVYELMAAGTLASVKIGTARRIPREALTEFVARLASERAA